MFGQDHSVRWEQVPLTRPEDAREIGIELPPQPAEIEKQPKSFQEKIFKFSKILLPHIGLTVVLLCYIVLGAIVFRAVESEPEINYRKEKLQNISTMYTQIVNESWRMCQNNQVTFQEYYQTLQVHLVELSRIHEYDERLPEDHFVLNENELQTRWTFPAAVLYALTVLTTTGYDYITPRTNFGKLFCVFFGLIGIPLMFITAADIGKFLSDVFIALWAKWRKFYRLFWKKIWPRNRKIPSRSASMLSKESLKDFEEGQEGEENSEEDDGAIELPVVAYFGLILTYCSLGALLFTSYETAPIWTFLHAFHFSFNTITTISLGIIVVKSLLYLAMVVAYVIIGLSVVTMCVDLASSHLKVIFSRIHYFGRRMRGARLADDLREAMKVLAAIRKHKTGKLTAEDIRKYLEVQKQFIIRPFIPSNIHFIRFVDEDQISSRSGSGHSFATIGRMGSENNIPMI